MNNILRLTNSVINMEPQKAIKKITLEIIQELRLPVKLTYPVIYAKVQMAMGVGYNLGRDTTKRSKPVVRMDDNKRFIQTYISLAAAARDVGLANYSSITKAINRKGKSAGYYWKLLNPNDHYVYKRVTNGTKNISKTQDCPDGGRRTTNQGQPPETGRRRIKECNPGREGSLSPALGDRF